MKIIKKRQHHEVTSYHRSFERKSLPGSGYWFDSDKDGNVDLSQLTEIQLESWKTAQSEDYTDEGMVPTTNRYTEPAVGLCNRCNAEVSLSSFTNTCECGADYNMSGQELAPRSQWGEETGETADQILGYNSLTVDQCFDGEDY